MSKKIGAESKSIGQLLGRWERRPVILPQFQRPYSWDKSKVLAFWNDIAGFRSVYDSNPTTASYYLGAIVVVDSEDKLLLLDGQQRLATATIMLAAIRDVARGLGTAQGTDLARDTQRELIEKSEDPITFSLTLGELDEEHFRKRIKADPPEVHNAKLRSHAAMDAARQILAESILASLQGIGADAQIKRLKLLKDTLTKGTTLIEILVPSEDDAVQIFETLNDRGLRLSVPDLVLNLLMKREGDKEKRSRIRNQWNEVVRGMGKRDPAKFLRHYWVSHYGDVKNQSLFSEIRSKLESDGISSLDFAEHCSDECEIYVGLLDNSLACEPEAKANLDGLIRYLDVQNCLPLLLAGYRCLSKVDFTKLTHMILCSYVRHSLVCNKNPLEFETILYRAAREARSEAKMGKTSARILASVRDLLKELRVENDEVKKSAEKLELARGEAQWLIAQIANSLQSRTKEIAMANCNLEHILPIKPAPEWGDTSDFTHLTWSLGNLTILSEKLNSGAQNKKFKTKRDAYYSKSEVKMTQALTSVERWTSAEILERASKLASEMVKIWPALQ